MGDEYYAREDREYWTVRYDEGDIVFGWDDDNEDNNEDIILDEELDDESLKGPDCE